MCPLSPTNTDSQQRLYLQPSLSIPFPLAWCSLAMLSVQPSPNPSEQNCLGQSQQVGRPGQAGSGILAVGHDRQFRSLRPLSVQCSWLNLTAGLEARKG